MVKAGSWRQNLGEVATPGYEVRSNEGWKSSKEYQKQRERLERRILRCYDGGTNPSGRAIMAGKRLRRLKTGATDFIVSR